MIRRDFVTGMEGVGDLTTTGSVAPVGVFAGQLRLSPTSTTPAGIGLKGGFVFESGLFTVGISVAATSGANCTVQVVHTTTTTLGTFSTAGFHEWSSAAVLPGTTVDDVTVTCTGTAGDADLDWLTIQNGSYEWAPMMDVDFDFDHMGVPSGGRQSVLRVSEEFSATGLVTGGIVLAGSDVGGLAWTPMHDPETQPTDWHVANGRFYEWNDTSELGVMDVLATWRGDEQGGYPNYRDPDEFDVYALTGSKALLHGGLWYSADVSAPPGSQSWIEVSADVNAFKIDDDCGAGTAISSGRLLLLYPGDPDWLVIGSGGDAEVGSTRGVYFWERGAYSTPPAEKYTGLPDDNAGYDGLPSALAAGSVWALNESTSQYEELPYLLVGYRVLADSSADSYALYVCPADFDPATGPTNPCEPVLDGTLWPTDVRDIEPDPNVPERAFVADAGGYWDTADDACATNEATVFGVELFATIETSGTIDWSFEVWDTDAAPTADDPSWLNADTADTDAEYYAGTEEACVKSGSGPLGNLLPPIPSDDGGEDWDLSTLAIDPSGEHIVAFYPKGASKRTWGCPGVFRADLAGLAVDDTLAWVPLQDYQYGEMGFYLSTSTRLGAGPHADQRRASIDVAGSFMEAEPLIEAWAGSGTHDAAFVPSPSGLGGRVHLLTGGNHHWWAFADADDTGSDVGWNSPWEDDLDQIDWKLAWADDADGAVFQDLTATTLTVCPGCDASVLARDVLLGGGAGDFKYFRLFPESGGVQPAAERPCELGMLQSAPVDADIWVDLESNDPAQVWLAMKHQQGALNDDHPHVDPSLGRAIFFSEGSSTSDVGDEWCWDGYYGNATRTRMGFVAGNYLGSTSGSYPDFWELVCQDSSINTGAPGFLACDSSDRNRMQVEEVGMVRAIEAIGPDLAVILAVAACVELDCGTSADEQDATRGLWVVTNTGSGLAYEKVPFPSGGVDGCLEEDFFEYDWVPTSGEVDGHLANRRQALSVHPDSLGATTGSEVRLFASSTHQHCGVLEVTFDVGDEANATWSRLDLGFDGPDPGAASDCVLFNDTSNDSDEHDWTVNGTHATRDGDWLLVYGGSTQTRFSTGLPIFDAICAVDLTTGSAGSYTRYQPVVRASEVQMEVFSVISHPHVDDIWYFGGHGSEACEDPPCKPGGAFALQRRRAWIPALGTWGWAWGSKRVAFDDFAFRIVRDLDMGPGLGGRTAPITTLYISGGGWWDGEATW